MITQDIKAAVAQADETGELLTRYLERVGQVREFVTAFKYAARHAEHAPAESELYWPTLMEGLQQLIPEDGKLDAACHKTMQTLREISEGAARPAGRAPAAPAAPEKQTRRAALASGAPQG
jgi:hypothetical protein